MQSLASYPAPCHFIGKRSTDKWSQDCGNAICSSGIAQQRWTLCGCCNESKDGERADTDASSTYARNRSAYYQGCGVWCQRTDETSRFKDKDREDEPDLDGKVLVELSPRRLKA
jgi:hypothetical protein